MDTQVKLTAWEIVNDKVRLTYSDGNELFVAKMDFDRAFGCIVSAPKAAVLRDFAIS